MADIHQPAFDALESLVEAANGNAQALATSAEDAAELVRKHIMATEIAGRIMSELLEFVCTMTGFKVETIPIDDLTPSEADIQELMKKIINGQSVN